MKSKGYIGCSSCHDKYICPHASRGNWCGTKKGETRPDFGRKKGIEHLGPERKKGADEA